MRIVIVEDAAPIRRGLCSTLCKLEASYEVVGEAADGAEGLALIEAERPDLVITDIRMPEMDGLLMLKELRKREIDCRVIVLTAYSDFDYAKRAIELGIDNYLLKPIKMPELKRALKQAAEAAGRRKGMDQAYTLDYLFQSGAAGLLERGSPVVEAVRKQFGFEVGAPMNLFVVRLGKSHGKYRDTAAGLLEKLGANSQNFDCYIMEDEEKQLFSAVIYNIAEGTEVKGYFQQSILPMLSANLKHKAVYGWGDSEGAFGLNAAFKQVLGDLEWCLVFGEDILISHDLTEVSSKGVVKYPMDLEARLKTAVARKDREEFVLCFQRLVEACGESMKTPKEVKDACLEFCLTIIRTGKEWGPMGESLSTRELLQEIAASVTWEEIREVVEKVFEQSVAEPPEAGQRDTSLLVQKAQALIAEYYSQGLTLEETARRLYVTDEYLSAQFKKETGKTFSETIRACRIERVKQLLVESDLKLNQIAAMAGYSDPKYMSKVFREEVGIPPADYRKMKI